MSCSAVDAVFYFSDALVVSQWGSTSPAFSAAAFCAWTRWLPAAPARPTPPSATSSQATPLSTTTSPVLAPSATSPTVLSPGATPPQAANPPNEAFPSPTSRYYLATRHARPPYVDGDHMALPCHGKGRVPMQSPKRQTTRALRRQYPLVKPHH